MPRMVSHLIVLVLAIACGCEASAQRPSVAPQSDAAFYGNGPSELITELGLKPLSGSDYLGRTIVQASTIIDRNAGFVTKVWTCAGCGGSSSHPSLGIILDISQLTEIQRKVQGKYFPFVLLFLLGHEKAHQRQFHRYTAALTTATETQRQFYEAQADILGGVDLGLSLSTSTDYLQHEALQEALEVAYSLGTEQYALADHPNQNARVSAVHLGVAAGVAINLGVLGDAGARAAGMPTKKLHLRPGDDMLEWSIGTAKKIVNFERPAILSLVRTSDHITFDRSSLHPFVKYDVSYQNQGQQSIDVDMEIQCAAVPRDNRKDLIHSEIADTEEVSFTLRPGATKRLTGTMRWIATRDLMPWIRSAPDPSAFVTVAVSGSWPASSNGSTGGSMFFAGQGVNNRTTAGYRENVGNVVGEIVQAGAGGYMSLRAGPGQYDSELEALFYPTDPQYPGSLRTELEIDKSSMGLEPSVIATLYDSDDLAQAKAIYADTLPLLRQTLSKLNTWSERNTARGIVFELGPNSIWLSMDDRTSRKRVSILFSSQAH